MSYHIKLKDFECPECQTIYMPYSADVVCPKCKKLNQVDDPEYFNFIDQVLTSMRAHKIQYSEYHPSAWYRGSLAEYIQSVTFSLFDVLEYKKPSDQKAFVENWIMSNPDGERYWNEHMRDIELKIYEAYEKSDLKNPSIKDRLSIMWIRFLRKLLP